MGGQLGCVRDPQDQRVRDLLPLFELHLFDLLRAEELAADHVGCTVELGGTADSLVILWECGVGGAHVAGVVAQYETQVEGFEVCKVAKVGEAGG